MGINKTIKNIIQEKSIDFIWIDKGLIIHDSLLKIITMQFKTITTISYSPDDMLNPNNQSKNYLKSIPLYDFHITTKSYNVPELKALGAKDVIFIDNAYAPHIHNEYFLERDPIILQHNGVLFIGSYEKERAHLLEKIAEKGFPLTVWGNWPKAWVHRLSRLGVKIQSTELIDLDYSRTISSYLINLNFLRKVNRDLQTTRSIEIPACGGFMLAERTEEHKQLFTEGIEADYFSNEDELLAKVDFYLKNPTIALNIAKNGKIKCETAGYSNQKRLSFVIGQILKKKKQMDLDFTL